MSTVLLDKYHIATSDITTLLCALFSSATPICIVFSSNSPQWTDPYMGEPL